MSNKEKKKILIGSIAIVIVLILIVVGTTYAYFNFGVISNENTTNIEITTGERDQIKLNGGITNYHIHLKVSDMTLNKVGESYYGTTEEGKDYEETEELGTQELANIEVVGELVDEYKCSATINVSLDGEMKNKLQENDLVLVIKQGSTINSYDLSKVIENPTFKFILNGTEIEPIKAYLKFTNQNTDQSELAGKELNITINVSDFACEVKKESPMLQFLHTKTDKEHLKEAYIDDELTRYIGTYEEITNNYICFGADEETCKSDKDTYMYRIIGITNDNVNTELGLEEGQLKIIKAIPVKEANTIKYFKWATDYTPEYCGQPESETGKCQWDYAGSTETDGPILRWYLNNTFISTISGSTGGKNW